MEKDRMKLLDTSLTVKVEPDPEVPEAKPRMKFTA